MQVLAINYIVSDPEKFGGRPRINGTGITVDFLARYLVENLASVDEICRLHDLTPAQVHAAWSYYYDHQGEIEVMLAKNETIISSLPSFRAEIERRQSSR